MRPEPDSSQVTARISQVQPGPARTFVALLERLNTHLYNALACVAGERLREAAPSRSSAKRRSATNIQQLSELLELFGADVPRQGPKSVRT
jgi:hypothetical protein